MDLVLAAAVSLLRHAAGGEVSELERRNLYTALKLAGVALALFVVTLAGYL